MYVLKFEMNVRIRSSVLMKYSIIACVGDAWKQWAQEKTGAREGDTFSRAPVLSFAHYFQAPAMQASFVKEALFKEFFFFVFVFKFIVHVLTTL